MTLAIVNQNQAIQSSSAYVPKTEFVQRITEISKVVAYSGFINTNAPKNDMTQRSADAFFVMMYGHELGLSPITSLKTIYVIDGKPSCSGQALLAVIRRAGFDVIVPDPATVTDKATIKIKRPGGEWREYSYTTKDATAAGLIGRNTWKKHKSSMLIWRAVSIAARFEASDVTQGLYLIEEISDNTEVNESGEPVNPQEFKQQLNAAIVEETAQAPQEDTPTPPTAPTPSENGSKEWYEQSDKWKQMAGFWQDKLGMTPDDVHTLMQIPDGVKVSQWDGWKEYETGAAAFNAVQATHAQSKRDNALPKNRGKSSNTWTELDIDMINDEVIEQHWLSGKTVLLDALQADDWKHLGSNINEARDAIINHIIETGATVKTTHVTYAHKNYSELTLFNGRLRVRVYGRDSFRELFPNGVDSINSWDIGKQYELPQAVSFKAVQKDGYIIAEDLKLYTPDF